MSKQEKRPMPKSVMALAMVAASLQSMMPMYTDDYIPPHQPVWESDGKNRSKPKPPLKTKVRFCEKRKRWLVTSKLGILGEYETEQDAINSLEKGNE